MISRMIFMIWSRVGSTVHVYSNRSPRVRFLAVIKLAGVHSGEYDDEPKVAIRICFIICTDLQRYVSYSLAFPDRFLPSPYQEKSGLAARDYVSYTTVSSVLHFRWMHVPGGTYLLIGNSVINVPLWKTFVVVHIKNTIHLVSRSQTRGVHKFNVAVISYA